MVVEIDGLWKLAGMISSCIHMPVVKENGKTVTICDLNNYLVYTDVSKFNSWIERVIIDSYNRTLDGVDETSAGQSNKEYIQPNDDDVDEVSAGQPVLGNTFQMKLFFIIIYSIFQL
jgi:hypothetical protein